MSHAQTSSNHCLTGSLPTGHWCRCDPDNDQIYHRKHYYCVRRMFTMRYANRESRRGGVEGDHAQCVHSQHGKHCKRYTEAVISIAHHKNGFVTMTISGRYIIKLYIYIYLCIRDNNITVYYCT